MLSLHLVVSSLKAMVSMGSKNIDEHGASYTLFENSGDTTRSASGSSQLHTTLSEKNYENLCFYKAI